MVKLTEQNREQYEKSILDALNAEEINAFRDLFLELHPMDQIDIFNDLNKDQRQKVYAFLSPKEFSDIFEDLEVGDQKKIIQELEQQYTTDVITHMYADDIADFLGEMKDENAEEILKGLDQDDAEDIKELLSYEEGTSGAIMTKEFISVRSENLVKDVIDQLRQEGPDAETIYYLYVTNAKHELVGVVSLRDLIIANPEKQVEDVMSTRVVSVATEEDQEDVANLMKKYDFLAVPVVTAKNKLVGIITVDDILDVMEEEATEDLGEIAAARGATDVNVSPIKAASRRAPWIVLLMFFGMITANVIGQFEDTLEQIVLLAAFIPLIMDSAGNTGTQSLAVAVRGLALGTLEKKGVGKMILREFSTGIMLGLLCAVVLMIIVPIFYDPNVWLAFTVGISIFFSLSIATVIGTIVPLVINKLKLDPAIASGPFITTVNDILGLMVYFSIATAMMDLLL
ncbi:magnesium transporter [Texcoconibacillus texcoconensis]|uniref:Magnesium transporter MgtE n=1 Tax=Texcoconibacillus texcoconensis TaxID=1095777 RepID=A0A840QSG4_9BACI|nr:magnesium transporter [Texcoconibacillus texcoconensis]MBB5174258.1 magnesium transporter [Texcoconibacillus texcoconensis]